MVNSLCNSPLDVLLVTSNYPYEGHPNVGTFVAALAEKWARDGDLVRVVAPLPVWTSRTKEFVWRHPSTQGPFQPDVLHPSFLSYSNRRIGPISTHSWTQRSLSRAAARGARQSRARPDIVYSHFLFPAGAAGVDLAEAFGCPSVVALGESSFDSVESTLGRDRIAAMLRRFDGILSVSQENARIVVDRYGADESKIKVVPNAVDTDRFRPHDRLESRRRLGLPEDAMILSFTGFFIDRKGPLRVVEAMQRVPGLHGVFLGDGPQMPTGERVLHAGRVEHGEVAHWLSASDFFVLPTRSEGSPNAVLEAMACGLPIVSSDIPSLRETVDDEAAILVDPEDVSALAEALTKLSQDPHLRRFMGAASLDIGRRSNLDVRAAWIREWLVERIEAFSTASE
jgi:glycosyltransferase involved in cell wall biosynthesis